MTVSFNASATSTATAITIPSGALVGDWAILFDHAHRSSGGLPSSTVPTGWTQIGSPLDNGSTRKWIVSYKILVSGDPGSPVSGMGGDSNTDEVDKVMFVFSSSTGSFTSATSSTWNGQQTTADPTSQTVSASGQTTPLIVLGQSFCSNAAGAFSTASPAFDSTVANGSTHMLGGYKIYNSSPSNHTIDQNDLGATNCLRSGYVQLVEAAAAAVSGRMFAIF